MLGVRKCSVYHLRNPKTNPKTLCSIPEFIQSMTESSDFVSYNVLENETLCLFYYKSVVEALIIKQFILTPLKRNRIESKTSLIYVISSLLKILLPPLLLMIFVRNY